VLRRKAGQSVDRRCKTGPDGQHKKKAGYASRSIKEKGGIAKEENMSVGSGWDIPDGLKPWQNFHWFQPSPRSTIRLVILSEQPIWYAGHFVNNRMAPCCGQECDLCAAGTGVQIRYCFAVVEPLTRRVGLIEFGESNGRMIRDWGNRNGGIRGVQIEVFKHSKSAQSRTQINYIDEIPPLWIASCDIPDPALALYLTWSKANMPMPSEFALRMSAVLERSEAERATRRKMRVG
jgi:hypothetical protein